MDEIIRCKRCKREIGESPVRNVGDMDVFNFHITKFSEKRRFGQSLETWNICNECYEDFEMFFIRENKNEKN